MSKATPLLVSENDLLESWCRDVVHMFNDETPYQVGSSMRVSAEKYRDIDIRIMLEDEVYDSLVKILNIAELNLATSLWGQRVTGLPIDFQVQRRSYANSKYGNQPRNAKGIFRRRADDAGVDTMELVTDVPDANSKGGECEVCKGTGGVPEPPFSTKDMHPYGGKVKCPACGGTGKK